MINGDSYGFRPDFEVIVAVMCASKPRFYGRVGHALDSNAFESDATNLIVKASQAIGKELGTGPGDHRTVLQRLRRWVEEGKVTEDQLIDVEDVFIDAPASLPHEEEVLLEVVAAVKRRMQASAVQVAVENFKAHGDFSEVTRIIQRANTLGQHDTSIGERLTPGNYAEIDRLAGIDRLPTGIVELDANLDGGLPRGATGLMVAGTGGGKSMFLTHVLSQAVRMGLFCVLATLELSKGIQLARLKANLSGFPIAQVQSGDAQGRASVTKRLDQMYPILGQCVIQRFPAKLTTIPDLLDWIKRCEEIEGYPVDLIVIDYLDKLKSHDRNDLNSYKAFETISEALRLYIEDTNKWLWTASQPRRREAKEKGRRIEADELADSQNKARVADLIISATREEDQLTYYCSKFRHGQSEWQVGPIPHDWSCARQVMMSDDI